MRLLLAGLFVFGGMLVAMGVLASAGALDRAPLVTASGLAGLFLLLCFGGLFLFNLPWGSGWRVREPEEYVRELDARGLLTSTDFRATRAFQVPEWGDEGSHYFIELEDGSVLYLNGQYLYDYEPVEDDPELSQPRRFPCEHFTIRRHRRGGYVVEILCRGRILEPETVVRHPSRRYPYLGPAREDGQIIRDRTYDQLRAELGSAAPSA